jgi:hypothetical protein
MGFGDALQQPDPPTIAEMNVMDAWAFCGGWQPMSLVMYAAMYPVEDPDILIEGMLTIRDALEKRED